MPERGDCTILLEPLSHNDEEMLVSILIKDKRNIIEIENIWYNFNL